MATNTQTQTLTDDQKAALQDLLEDVTISIHPENTSVAVEFKDSILGVAPDEQRVTVNPQPGQKLGVDLTAAQEKDVVLFILAHEIMHTIHSDLRGKQEFSEEYPAFSKTAGRLRNLTEDLYINREATAEKPGCSVGYGIYSECFMQGYESITEYPDAHAYVKATEQLGIGGTINGLKDADTDLKEYAARADEILTACETEDDYAHRDELTHDLIDLLQEYVDLENTAPPELPPLIGADGDDTQNMPDTGDPQPAPQQPDDADPSTGDGNESASEPEPNPESGDDADTDTDDATASTEPTQQQGDDAADADTGDDPDTDTDPAPDSQPTDDAADADTGDDDTPGDTADDAEQSNASEQTTGSDDSPDDAPDTDADQQGAAGGETDEQPDTDDDPDADTQGDTGAAAGDETPDDGDDTTETGTGGSETPDDPESMDADETPDMDAGGATGDGDDESPDDASDADADGGDGTDTTDADDDTDTSDGMGAAGDTDANADTDTPDTDETDSMTPEGDEGTETDTNTDADSDLDGSNDGATDTPDTDADSNTTGDASDTGGDSAQDGTGPESDTTETDDGLDGVDDDYADALSDMLDADEQGSSERRAGLDKQDYQDGSEFGDRVSNRLDAAENAPRTDIDDRKADRDKRIANNRLSIPARDVRRQYKTQRLANDFEEAFREFKFGKDEVDRHDFGEYVNVEGAIRRQAGDYNAPRYTETQPSKLGDRLLVVVADASSSMDELELKLALMGLSNAAEQIRDKLAIIAYSNNYDENTQLVTAPHEDFRDQHLDSFRTTGRTPTSYGIRDGRALADKITHREPVLIVITDGKANEPIDDAWDKSIDKAELARRESAEQVNAATREGYPVIGVGVGDDVNDDYMASIFDDHVHTDMHGLADKLAEIYEDQLRETNAQYATTY